MENKIVSFPQRRREGIECLIESECLVEVGCLFHNRCSDIRVSQDTKRYVEPINADEISEENPVIRYESPEFMYVEGSLLGDKKEFLEEIEQEGFTVIRTFDSKYMILKTS